MIKMPCVNAVRSVTTRSLFKANVYADILNKTAICDSYLVRLGLRNPNFCYSDRGHATKCNELGIHGFTKTGDYSKHSSLSKIYPIRWNDSSTLKHYGITSRICCKKSDLLVSIKSPLHCESCAFHSRCEHGYVFAKHSEDQGSKQDEIITSEAQPNTETDERSVSFGGGQQALGKLTTTHMRILYTCKVCGSKNMNTFSKTSYRHGVVIVTCQGCKNNHLIADNLGWFEHIDKRNIEEILASKGEKVKNISTENDTLEFCDNDVDA
ncbi:uncharacterized protein LOC121383220 [Gigantopelta aegis]|uniref:uncharacterized protein LOC121383220 n=1 Tax=Gigantopelta aegis TaxID=1735272 RepID=UPI001B88B690|nr:uncharacterized protein LOC121383220 [Gigantopelta aegis]